MHHMLDGTNMGLVLPKRVETAGPWQHIFVSREIIEHVAVSLKTTDSLLPLYLYPNSNESLQEKIHANSSWAAGLNRRVPNLNPDFVSDLESCLNLAFISDGIGDLTSTFGPEDIFYYIYAVLHSPTYRLRYAEFLKMDFPRVPLTSNVEMFRRLCALGKDLVDLHLLESPMQEASNFLTHYPITGDNIVEKGYPKYVPDESKSGRIYINQTQYLEGVPKDVWEFHVGGYQVCEKWLKDRRSRKLSIDDFTHYRKVIVALKETIRLMEEIDQAIPEGPIK